MKADTPRTWNLRASNWRNLGVGEHGLATLVDGGKVHEHGGVAVASPDLVDLVVEVVEVRLVLLAVLVPQYLHVLSIL